MVTLRLTQNSTDQAERFFIEISLEGIGPRRTAGATLVPTITENDRARIRWYLEDYLEHSAAPAPTIAAGVERRMMQMGRELFQSIFESNRDTIRLWNDVSDRLGQTRVEVSTGVREANAIPWELIRDPRTETPLALAASEFVRVQSQVARRPYVPEIQTSGPVRVLLVICRPAGPGDVPFRSVANRLVKSLTEAGDQRVQLEVLRPPSFDELARVLRRAKASGRPYHIVHFDGHGLFVNQDQLNALKDQVVFNPNLLEISGTGRHGYLCFEDPTRPDHMRPVDGSALGNLLYETEVPVLVLNACRSAFGDESTQVSEAAADKLAPQHEDQVRVYGSLAQAVVDAGVAGVIAMRYNVYVATAAQFVGELYEALAEGHSLGRAATTARKHLNEMPNRAVVGAPIPLQDWPVPTVHEAAPIRLFPARETPGPLFSLSERWRVKDQHLSKDELPPFPDAGFFGRDETLLAVDRAFDRHKIVLMYAYAGSGKTATAAEFARWYLRTGGIEGPVLFDSFEHYRPLSRLLDKIGGLFGPLLQRGGIHWLALNDAQRRALALDILKNIPVLWVWDNVEPITGFPAGSDSVWSVDEQAELADFLRALRDTKTKVLLTSRRLEDAWLCNLPARIRVPSMPERERRQLAEALIIRQGRDAGLLASLDTLLAFSQGNPLTLTTLINQALKDRLNNSADVENFVAKLRAGEALFDDDVDQGRTKSLGASLSYGFEGAFSEQERKRLALLYLFQSIVNPVVLVSMGQSSKSSGHRANYEGLTREYWRALLQRAADIGLLTSLSNRMYSVHPALPWFFRGLFEKYYRANSDGRETSATCATRAFIEAMAGLGNFFYAEFNGTRELMAALRFEEDNLLHAWRLARRHGWWKLAADVAGVICNFYGDTGRHVERGRLLRAIIADCLDLSTLEPLNGREECWFDAITNGLQIELMEHNIAAGERFYFAGSKHLLTKLGDSIDKSASDLSEKERDLIENYVDFTRIWIGGISTTGVRESIVAGTKLGEEVFNLASRLDDKNRAGWVAFHLGHCHFELGGKDDVLSAEKWYQNALDLIKQSDAVGRSMCLFELAQARYRLMQLALADGATPSAIEKLINEALRSARDAQKIVPPEHVEGRARVHHLLGNILDDAGSMTAERKYNSEAEKNYQEYIMLADRMGDFLDAAVGCREMARLKVKLGEYDDALVYANEALSKCEKAGAGGSDAANKSRQLIAGIGKMKLDAKGSQL